MLLEANGHSVNHTGISCTLRILVGLSVRVCVRVCPCPVCGQCWVWPWITKPVQHLHGSPRVHGPQTGIPARQDGRSRRKGCAPVSESSAEGSGAQTAAWAHAPTGAVTWRQSGRRESPSQCGLDCWPMTLRVLLAREPHLLLSSVCTPPAADREKGRRGEEPRRSRISS